MFLRRKFWPLSFDGLIELYRTAPSIVQSVSAYLARYAPAVQITPIVDFQRFRATHAATLRIFARAVMLGGPEAPVAANARRRDEVDRLSGAAIRALCRVDRAMSSACRML